MPQRFEVVAGRFVTVHGSVPLHGESSVEAAVIVVHGVLRNAEDYYRGMVAAARLAGVLERTAVFAPHFRGEKDVPGPGDLLWDGAWKHGAESTSAGAAVSAFSVLDRLVAHLVDSGGFPRLKRVVVTGHSAGGQMLGRYAFATASGGSSGVALRYVIANPSSWLYLDRWRDGATAGCLDFDDYPYGLTRPNGYLAAVGAERVRANARVRDVVLLVGERDTETEYLDTSCPAMLQGSNRYRRGLAYARYLDRFHAPHHVRLRTVPGVGHDADAIYASPAGRESLFGKW